MYTHQRTEPQNYTHKAKIDRTCGTSSHVPIPEPVSISLNIVKVSLQM